jgi:ribosomal protein S18 acetylase RimI-like enzyme
MVLDGAPDRTICWVSVDPRYNGRGLPHVTLGVDADNPTGATRLYERAGMRVEKEDVVFVKDLT